MSSSILMERFSNPWPKTVLPNDAATQPRSTIEVKAVTTKDILIEWPAEKKIVYAVAWTNSW